jgi:hypothetical protein
MNVERNLNRAALSKDIRRLRNALACFVDKPGIGAVPGQVSVPFEERNCTLKRRVGFIAQASADRGVKTQGDP